LKQLKRQWQLQVGPFLFPIKLINLSQLFFRHFKRGLVWQNRGRRVPLRRHTEYFTEQFENDLPWIYLNPLTSNLNIRSTSFYRYYS